MDRSFAALAIDHRYYRGCGGTPSQYEHYPCKVADLTAAVSTPAGQPEIDATRQGAVGVYLGAGYPAHAIQEDPWIKAFAAIAGYHRDVPAMKSSDPIGFEE